MVSLRTKISALGLHLSEVLSNTKINVIPCATASEAQKLTALLKKLRSDLNIHYFPDWEVLPYDRINLADDVVSKRLEVLRDIEQGRAITAITTPAGLMQRLPPKAWLSLHQKMISSGELIDRSTLIEGMLSLGYEQTATVKARGKFAIRGSIIDLFPFGESHPIRIELFDDEIERMQRFDLETQRAIASVEKFQLLSHGEVVLNDSVKERFMRKWREAFDNDERKCEIFKAISLGKNAPGIEHYLDLLHDGTLSLAQLCPDLELFLSSGIVKAFEELTAQCNERFERANLASASPSLPPKRIWADWPTIKSQLNSTPNQLSGSPWKAGAGLPSYRQLFIIQSQAQRHQLQGGRLQEWPSFERFKESGETSGMIELPITESVHCPRDHISMLVDQDELRGYDPFVVHHGIKPTKKTNKPSANQAAEPFVQLTVPRPAPIVFQPGDYLIHPMFGMCLCRGLQQSNDVEFLVLEFQHESQLLLPLDDLSQLTPFHGTIEGRELGILGRKKFAAKVEKAKKQVEDIAAKMIVHYADREMQTASRIQPDREDFLEFLRSFSYDDTDSQRRVTAELLHDLSLGRPMNRLLVGDVGYGKTEIAMRLCYAAALSGYQSCIMVPSSLLSDQHYLSFIERFSPYPIKIAKLDGTVTGKARTKLRAQVAAGEIDILIGTHALVRTPWEYKNLACMVIDEEHRFGVTDKERLQQQQKNLHVLRMSSTPIPRSLHRALSGFDTISFLNEAPEGRRPVATYVREWDNELVRDALRREHARGGQSFLVNDRVHNLDELADLVARLVPELTIVKAHGRRPNSENAQALAMLKSGHADVLVSTNIIQSGIDIGNCNTILIARSDRVGLAELHQLRGRVGRSDRQSWCWCLHPPFANVTKNGRKRLEVIVGSTSTGAGYELAINDLELRGGGELLGANQSGLYYEIGAHLYSRLLANAIKALQRGEVVSQETNFSPNTQFCRIETGIDYCFPEGYIDDPVERLKIYQRLDDTVAEQEIEQIFDEIKDRFGSPPDQARRLLTVRKLSMAFEKLGIEKIEKEAERWTLKVTEPSQELIDKMISLTVSQPLRYSLSPVGLTYSMKKQTDAVMAVEQILEHLQRAS